MWVTEMFPRVGQTTKKPMKLFTTLRITMNRFMFYECLKDFDHPDQVKGYKITNQIWIATNLYTYPFLTGEQYYDNLHFELKRVYIYIRRKF